MKPRHKRFVFIGLGLLALAVASMLILNAFQSNLVFFFTPTQVANAEAPKGRGFRIGGMGEAASAAELEKDYGLDFRAALMKAVAWKREDKDGPKPPY